MSKSFDEPSYENYNHDSLSCMLYVMCVSAVPGFHISPRTVRAGQGKGHYQCIALLNNRKYFCDPASHV